MGCLLDTVLPALANGSHGMSLPLLFLPGVRGRISTQQLSPQIATETVQSVRLPFPLHVNIRLKDTLTVVALLSLLFLGFGVLLPLSETYVATLFSF